MRCLRPCTVHAAGSSLLGWGPVGPTSPICASKTPHAPERGVGRPPRDGPPPSEPEHEVYVGSFPRLPLPPRKGGYRVGAQTTTTTCKAIMTDPPIDNTQAREQDAPGTHDAKRRAPVHGHTGDLPLPTRHSPTPSPH
eukprot:scaffold8003_cov115-Isochrysis_galbana.AAC.1